MVRGLHHGGDAALTNDFLTSRISTSPQEANASSAIFGSQDSVPGSMRLPENFRLDRHAEGHAEIFKSGGGVDALGQFGHALGVKMRLRQGRAVFVHHLGHGGVHHAAGTNHRGAVHRLVGEHAAQPFRGARSDIGKASRE